MGFVSENLGNKYQRPQTKRLKLEHIEHEFIFPVTSPSWGSMWRLHFNIPTIYPDPRIILLYFRRRDSGALWNLSYRGWSGDVIWRHQRNRNKNIGTSEQHKRSLEETKTIGRQEIEGVESAILDPSHGSLSNRKYRCLLPVPDIPFHRRLERNDRQWTDEEYIGGHLQLYPEERFNSYEVERLSWIGGISEEDPGSSSNKYEYIYVTVNLRN